MSRGNACARVLGGSLLAGVATFVSCDAHAIIIRDDVPDAEYVVADEAYPAVVTIFPPDDCGGTLIDPSHVLTVAHCAVDLTSGDAIEVAGVAHVVAEITLHPMWNDGDAYDIAVVRFEEAVADVDPIPLYRGTDELGAEVTLVGRGVTATGLVGESGGSSDGQLRRATNIVSAVDDFLIEVVFERPDEADVTPLEGVGASGDSGGPVFLDVDGVPHLAGLNAFGDAPNGIGIGAYGSWDYQTRVSRYADWVDGVIEAGASSGGDASSSSSDGSSASDGSSSTAGSTSGAQDPADGCGCTHGRGSLALLVLAFACPRRRRRAAHQKSCGEM